MSKRAYRHQNVPHENKIRVRGKRLDQVDSTKLTLAYWLLAKRLVENKSDTRSLSEAEVRQVMDRLDREEPQPKAKPKRGTADTAQGTPADRNASCD